jgi:hypothetical protein
MNKQSDPIASDVDQAARIAARRAQSQRNAEVHAQATATAAKLAVAARYFGEDAIENAETDPDTVAYKSARGERMNDIRATVARRRREGELKYADRWTPSDPTGEAAVSRGHDRLLLQADTFTFPTTGRRGATVDYVGLATALGENDEFTQLRVAAALNYAAPKGDIVKRARACGFSAADLATATTSYRPDMIR